MIEAITRVSQIVLDQHVSGIPQIFQKILCKPDITLARREDAYRENELAAAMAYALLGKGL
jgi:hypothetical protein